MAIKEQVNQDIKTAMLSGQKELVTTLRGIKSVILYAEVAANKRETGLPESDIISLLQKEAKKRQESADLYTQGDDAQRAAAELAEQVIIQKYLPAALSESDVKELVEQEVAKLDGAGQQQMGQIIGAVKKASGGAADGALIAQLVKERLGL